MNGVEARQEREYALQRLAAARATYSKAKRIRAVVFTVSIVAPTILFLWGLDSEEVAYVAGVVGLVVVAVTYGILELWHMNLVRRAADFQEAADVYIFQIAPHAFLGARWPSSEEAGAMAERAAAQDYGGLHKWYGKMPSQIALPRAAMLCQRMNIGWDADQRKFYAAMLACTSAAVVVAVVVLGIAMGMSLPEFLLRVALPTLPVFAWLFATTIRHALEHSFLKTKLLQLEQAWPTMSGLETARQVQDVLLVHRGNSLPVPDWVHKLRRKKMESKYAKLRQLFLAEEMRRAHENA